jgi:hypothetical protein
LARSTKASSRSYSPPVSATSTPSGFSRRRRFGLVSRTAKDGSDSGEQFARVERFGDIVVGAEFQADDAIGLLAHGGEHDDGDFRLGAQPSGEVEAGFAGQHQVEHDKLVVAVEPGASGFLAVADGGDADALLFKEAGEQVADFAVVIDDEDVGRLVHALLHKPWPGLSKRPLHFIAIRRLTERIGAAMSCYVDCA